MMEKETVIKTDLIPMVDNLIIPFDTSGSSNEMVPGRDVTKIRAAKYTLKERNAWFPDLSYRAGLYIYTDNQTLMGTFKEVVGMRPYDRATFAVSIDQLPDKGQRSTMKILTVLSIVAMLAMVLCPPLLAAETPSAKSAGPDEAKV
jgi:hypothetical protein